MRVQQAIEELKKLPPDAHLMMADMGVGGSVELDHFEVVDEEWIDLIPSLE